MTSPKSHLQAHVFICTHFRETGESCGAKGSEEIRKDLKEKFSDSKAILRINSAGCLGKCAEGITAVCYPKGEWKTHLQNENSDTVSDWIRYQITHAKK